MQPSASNQKECPFCKELIQAAAIICKHCSFDTTAQYEPCKQCGELIKCAAILCRHCNFRKPGGGGDEGVGSSPQPKKPSDRPTRRMSMPSSGKGFYGEGVRGQVFEVIVRQGMAGAPWKTICAGPMQVNNITADEVEAEIRRRQNLLS